MQRKICLGPRVRAAAATMPQGADVVRYVQVAVTPEEARDVQWAVATGTPVSLVFDAPTEVFPDGAHVWRDSAGRLHRLGGPAVIRADGSREWWLDGTRLPCNDRRRAPPA